MKQNKIEIRFWPLRLSVEGDSAIAALKWPMAMLLSAISIFIVAGLFRFY